MRAPGDGAVTVSLVRVEARNLHHLVDEFLTLLAAPVDGDPAFARLRPDAYPDDRDAGAEFRRATGGELLERRRADAEVVRAELAAAGAASDDDTDPLTLLKIRLDSSAVECWMRTLAAIRLVVAARLGVDREDRHDADDARFGVYDWLAYRLDDLIRLADESDGATAS